MIQEKRYGTVKDKLNEQIVIKLNQEAEFWFLSIISSYFPNT
jgi:hypothetical protein